MKLQLEAEQIHAITSRATTLIQSINELTIDSSALNKRQTAQLQQIQANAARVHEALMRVKHDPNYWGKDLIPGD